MLCSTPRITSQSSHFHPPETLLSTYIVPPSLRPSIVPPHPRPYPSPTIYLNVKAALHALPPPPTHLFALSLHSALRALPPPLPHLFIIPPSHRPGINSPPPSPHLPFILSLHLALRALPSLPLTYHSPYQYIQRSVPPLPPALARPTMIDVS